LIRGNGDICLEVRDEGQGISKEILEDLTHNYAKTGVGIFGLRERLRHVGGRLEIDSSVQGTVVKAFIPVVSEKVRATDSSAD
jgi:signal transduction histidine kinase